MPICLPKRTNTHINIQVYLYIHTSVCVTVCRYALQLHCGSLFPLPFPIIRTYVCKQVCCGGSGYSLGWLADSRYRLSASWLTVHVLDTCMCWFMDGVLQRTLNTHKHIYIYMHTYRHIYVYNSHLPAASHQLLAACHYYERLYWFDVALLLLLLLLLLLCATFNCT